MRHLRPGRYAPIFVAAMILTTLTASWTPVARGSVPPRLSDFRVPNPDPDQQADIAVLRGALAERGIGQDGIGVFAIPTVDGLSTVVTRLPDAFGVTPLSGGIYDVTRIEAAVPVGGARPGFAPRFRAADAGGWRRNNADCDIYSTKGFARTQCFEIDQQNGDSDPGRAFWQYTAEASGHSKGGRRMDRMWVERRPADGFPHQDFDGIPEPKEATQGANHCRAEDQSVSFAIGSGVPLQVGASHTWHRTTCEAYRPQMYEDQGHWATIWDGNPNVSEKEVRHVLFTMPVKTAEGALPGWVRLNGQHTTR